jgi:hypothetical protein
MHSSLGKTWVNIDAHLGLTLQSSVNSVAATTNAASLRFST